MGGVRGGANLAHVLVPVTSAGVALSLLAAISLVRTPPAGLALVGALILLGAAIVAEAYPVPVEGVSAGGVSLAAAFLVGAAILYGWEVSTLLGLVTRGVIELINHRPLTRLGYNSATYAISAAAAGAVLHAAPKGSGAVELTVCVALGAIAFYSINIILIALVVARASGGGFDAIVRQSVRWTAIPFAIMASVSLMLAVLWQRSPGLAAALIGPVVATVLYQRSTHRELEALRLAKTDPLTGLGNHRAFYERLAQVMEADHGQGVVLCMLDADGFKRVNDRLGHKSGDELLAQIGRVLAGHGEGFRIGGDEFALLLPGPPTHAAEVAGRLVERVSAIVLPGAAAVTVSAGLAAYPRDASNQDDLFRAADVALYHAKLQGKNRVATYTDVIPDPTGHTGRDPDLLRTAWKLADILEDAGAVGGNDVAYEGHAERVAQLAARIAIRFNLPADEVELVRLAAQMHDIGKVAIPLEVLTKASHLDSDEHRLLGDHPRIGARILGALGGSPIARWVYHHHERWDGFGYPDRLSGTDIPLPSRIIFVADAYDAMTSERPYRPALSRAEAISEVRRCAGTQFDPEVVEALVAVVGEPKSMRVVAAA